MLAQIKTDDALTAAWWHDLQQVVTLPNGQPANVTESVRKAYAHLTQTTPAGGIYCVAAQTGHQAQPHHKWFSSAEGAVVYAIYESLVRHCKNVWYATSSFTDEPELNRYGNPSRNAKNVVSVKSFWIDLDVAQPIPPEWVEPIRMLSLRTDKHDVIARIPSDQQKTVRDYLKELDKYPSQQSAVEGLIDFIQKTNLVPTSVVSSGRGIHVYWSFSESVTANSWKQVAEGLKALADAHGLKQDHSRTADSASLMRLPGTWHRKGDPLEVYTIKTNEVTYTFEALSAQIKEKLRVVNPSVVRNMQNKHAPTGVAAALIRPHEFPPANAELVATKCQQVKFFRQSRGMVDEPLWYVLAGTLGHCVDGEAYFQEWSSGHPQYNYNATQAKLEQWMERATGPSSCGAFEAKNPTGCAGCPFKGKIAFPVQLGEDAAPLVEEVVIPPLPMADALGEVESHAYKPPTQLGSFRRTTKGIQVVDDALPAPITICDFDVWITRNSHDRYTDSRVVNLCYRDNHNDVFEYQLKASILSDQKSLLTWLYDKGLYIKPEHAKAMSSYLQAYINDLARNQKTITLHSAMGWAVERDTDGREKETVGFVLGNKLITPKGTVEAGLSPRVKDYSQEYHGVGDKDAWVRSTRVFQQKGLEGQAFALLCGFGAPLMKFSGGINGSMVSMVGPTGTGKTSAMTYALSIFGRPKDVKMKWGDTLNSIYYKIGATKDMPIALDECTNAEPLDISQLAYDVSNGKPKSRLKSDASLQTSEKELWHLIMLATSNESLLEKVKMEKSDPTAALARILEYRIEYDDRWMDFCGNELIDVVENHYGSIGEEYLRYVVANRETLKEVIPSMMKWVKDNGSTLGQHRFLNATVACALVGGQIAKNLGLIDFDLTQVTEWIMQLLRDYGGKSKSHQINPYEMLGTFLAENNGKILSVGHEVNGVAKFLGELPRGVIVARLDMGIEKLYLRKDAFERWMTNRKINHGEVLTQLMRSELMDRTPQATNVSRGMPGAPPTVVPCYVLDAKKLGIKVEMP